MGLLHRYYQMLKTHSLMVWLVVVLIGLGYEKLEQYGCGKMEHQQPTPIGAEANLTDVVEEMLRVYL